MSKFNKFFKKSIYFPLTSSKRLSEIKDQPLDEEKSLDGKDNFEHVSSETSKNTTNIKDEIPRFTIEHDDEDRISEVDERSQSVSEPLEPNEHTLARFSNPDAIENTFSALTDVGAQKQPGRPVLDMLKQKVIQTNELINKERKSLEEDVAEYLRLTANADRQQATRIRGVFDKKNKTSYTVIEGLQKKIESYNKKMKELEPADRSISSRSLNASAPALDQKYHHHHPKSSIQIDKMENLDEVESMSKHRFHSSDDIFSQARSDLPSGLLSGQFLSRQLENLMPKSDPTSIETVTESLNVETWKKKNPTQFLTALVNQLQVIHEEIQELHASQRRVEKKLRQRRDDMKISVLRQLDEDSIRREEQMNDLSDLHQKEMALLKLELASMEDKIEYNARERARDIQEVLESCQNRITTMEMHQQRHEVVDPMSNDSALPAKLIHVAVSLLALCFVVVSTVQGFVRPFIQSSVRIFLTISLLVLALDAYFNRSVIVSTAYNLTMNAIAGKEKKNATTTL